MALLVYPGLVGRLLTKAERSPSPLQTDRPSAVSSPPRLLPGDYIGKVTPVPISNTVVKLSEPMIVPEGVKVGIAGILNAS